MIDDGVAAGVGRIDPRSAWRLLSDDERACLVDVRTRQEWTFVGAPDLAELGKPLWALEWRVFPDMRVNSDFEAAFTSQFQSASPSAVLFICRSGARSMEAAQQMRAALGDAAEGVKFYNVEEGFEGDLSSEGRRGAVNGWKAHGLPWRQS